VNPEAFIAFKHEAIHELTRLNEECRKAFRVGEWQRWDYDLERKTLIFSQDGVPRVIATIQVVGTTSERSGTWLWSWANTHLPPIVTAQIDKVRAFGEKEGLAELTEASATDDEHLGWSMTAVAARVLGSRGAYRCPGSNGFVYLVFTDIAFADQPRTSSGKVACSEHEWGYEAFIL
jgi:hypothetical protein